MAINTEQRHVEAESYTDKTGVGMCSRAEKEPLHGSCNACPYCADCCKSSSNIDCDDCTKKNDHSTIRRLCSAATDVPACYTRCEIRRHNTSDSAWLVAGDSIYDATEYMNHHPGGRNSILKKAGGVADCTEDLKFHSCSGRKVWSKYYLGKVIPCPGSNNERQWWQFWT